MSDLIDFVIDRHGGLQRWQQAASVSADVHVHGGFWGFKGQPDLLGHQSVIADVHRQRITMTPFGAGRTLEFDGAADRVAILDRDGQVVDELAAPRASMAGFAGDTPWTPTQTGYFISYATWMYLLEPFLFTLPGVETREIEPWEEDGERWRRLEVTLPETIASHSSLQTYYFNAETGLQRRMDYDVEVNGWANVAHYTSEHKTFDDLIIPTRRRVLLRNEESIADHRFAAILLDVDDVRLTADSARPSLHQHPQRHIASQYTTPNLTVDAPNGTTYAYRRYGKVDTVPVVFFQHFRGNLDNWDPALVDDIASEREVILFDASGVGLSTGPVPTTFEKFGRDALAFIDALGLTEVDLFGFSIGGFVAQEVALQRPHLVRRVILAGTGPQGGREMHGWIDEARAHAMKDVQGAEDILYLFFSPSEASQAKGIEFVTRIFTRTDERDTTPDLAVRDAQAAAIIEWGIGDLAKLSRLANIRVPTLVANGDNDVMVPTVNSYLLAGHLPNAKLTIYPDAAHGFLFQYPHRFAAEVNAFLAA